MARLKVFTTPSGFYDLAVAAPSQAAALRAWGIRQNLFAEGMAKIASDKATVDAALAKPGVVLKRLLGTKGAFAQDASRPKVKGGGKKTAAKPSAAEREKVARAKREIEEAGRDHAKRAQALKDELSDIETRIAEEDDAWRKRRRELTDDLKRAKKALKS